MGVLKTEVFLVQGQRLIDGGERLDGKVEQIVVLAKDREAVGEVLKANAPDFSLLGMATLEDYEATAAKLREVVAGRSQAWPVLVAEGIVVN